MFTVTLSRKAIKQLKSIPKHDSKRISDSIIDLGKNPYPRGCEKMKNQIFFRIRVGNYRVIYEVENNELKVYVIKVGHRKDVYKGI